MPSVVFEFRPIQRGSLSGRPVTFRPMSFVTAICARSDTPSTCGPGKIIKPAVTLQATGNSLSELRDGERITSAHWEDSTTRIGLVAPPPARSRTTSWKNRVERCTDESLSPFYSTEEGKLQPFPV